MSKENKTVELKDEELEKVSGGSREDKINECISKLNTVSDGGGVKDIADLINGALTDINNGALSDAFNKLKTIIETYGPLAYMPLYTGTLNVVQEVYWTFKFDLHVSL